MPNTPSTVVLEWRLYADRLAQQEQLRRLYPRREREPMDTYLDDVYSRVGTRWSQWL